MNKIIKTIILAILIFYSANNSFAADVYFETYSMGDEESSAFLVKVILDTKGESLNAIEGKIVYPEELLEISEIHDGDSSINFWIDKPHTVSPGEVMFSGIIPGGFVGEGKLLFSMLVNEKEDSKGLMKLENLRVLRNDSEGSSAKVNVYLLELPISTKSNIENKNDTDTDPPEDFKPEIIANEDLFEGKTVLLFATQDKSSGIKHYEVKEGYWDEFKIVTSPYVLDNQSANKKILIKAVDNASNERIVEFYPDEYKPWYLQSGIIGIMLVIAIYLIRKIWRKFIR